MPLNTSDIPASSATLFYNSRRSFALDDLIHKLSGISDTDWDSLEIFSDGSQINLHKSKWMAGNFVSVAILKVLNFMKREFGGEVRQDPKIDLLLESNFMTGLIFQPQLMYNDPRIIVFEQLLSQSSGVLFNGQTLFTSNFEYI